MGGGIARRTGLDAEAIEMVLQPLTRVSLFRQQGDGEVRAAADPSRARLNDARDRRLSDNSPSNP
jgi:hypothetical protein